MSANVNNIDPNHPACKKPGMHRHPNRAEALRKFEEEKAAALSAAQGNPALIGQINAITPHKGAIEELEALLTQALRGGTQTPRTIGIV